LQPAAVIPQRDDNWETTYKITFPNGTTDTLPADQILHIRLFSTDGLNGINPIQWGRNAMGLAKATERHGSKLFKNAALPSGGFATESTLKPDTYADLKEQLADMASGNAHRSMVLQGGLKWFQTSMTSEDAQFLDTRKFQRSEIAGMFRVPAHMIGDLEKATFSNIEHQGLSFVQHSLMPYLSRIEQRLKKSLLPKNDREHYFKFNANALLRGDMKARAEFYTRMQQTGSLSPNEIRAFEDMNPRDGGDIFLTPMNMLIDGKPAEDNDDVDKKE